MRSSLFDFMFNRMITTEIIQALFGIGVMVLSVGWFLYFVFQVHESRGAGLTPFIGGTIWALGLSLLGGTISVVALRVLCEGTIVVFRISEHLHEIKDILRSEQQDKPGKDGR